MIKLKKLIAIAVLVSMLPRTVMAQGEEKNVKLSEGQKVSTTEAEPNEENLTDMTATSEREASGSMELTDEHSRCDENKHSGSEISSEPDSDTEMAEIEENPGMSENKKERESDEDYVEKTTTVSERKDTESSGKSGCPVDAKEDVYMPRSKKTRVKDKNSIGEVSTTSGHEESGCKEAVCSETRSNEGDGREVTEVHEHAAGVKSADDIYEQGVQCEDNMEFCKAIKFYEQAAELGNTAAACKLTEFRLYDEEDFEKMCKWCSVASELIEIYEKFETVRILCNASRRPNSDSSPSKSGIFPLSSVNSPSPPLLSLSLETGFSAFSSASDGSPATPLSSHGLSPLAFQASSEDPSSPPNLSQGESSLSSQVELQSPPRSSSLDSDLRDQLTEIKHRYKDRITAISSDLKGYIKAKEFDKNSCEWYKNAARVIHMYYDALEKKNTVLMRKALGDFSEYCEIIKKELSITKKF